MWRKQDFKWIPQTLAGLGQLAKQGFEFIILSNQAGIGRGVVPPEAMTELHAWMVEQMSTQGICVKDIFVCPHHWEDKCICRKPLPALFYWASGKHRFLARPPRCTWGMTRGMRSRPGMPAAVVCYWGTMSMCGTDDDSAA